jgi:hypothetical protein
MKRKVLICMAVCVLGAVGIGYVIDCSVDSVVRQPQIITSETVRAYYSQHVLGSATVVDSAYFRWTWGTARTAAVLVRNDTLAFLED